MKEKMVTNNENKIKAGTLTPIFRNLGVLGLKINIRRKAVSLQR